MQFDTSLTVEAIVRLITVSTFWNWLDQVDGAITARVTIDRNRQQQPRQTTTKRRSLVSQLL
eukprot:m.66103 g.66103  ORF g.66103 m.66103 type:complete len:62 (+) comp14038_c0_seq2:163-348(+)